MTSVVLIDAGRSAVVPDGPDLPEPPARLTEDLAGDLIAALLRRTGLDRAELGELFLADPRCRGTGSPAGRAFSRRPLGLRTTVSLRSPQSMAQAVSAIEKNPEVVAVVAATDFGTGTGKGECAAELRRKRHVARCVAARWDISADEMADWARTSYTRSAECSAAGDFAAEIVSTTPGYRTDCFRKPAAIDSFTSGARKGKVPGRGLVAAEPVVTALAARGASAVILTSEANAIELGLRFRARVQVTRAVRSTGEFGIAPLDSRVVDDLLAPCGVDVGCLDQLEVPERYAVTPLAWIKKTGISEYLVNPRGGELAFGHLPRSGCLRSLVTMWNSLAATGGRAGALLASDVHRTAAFVLTLADPGRITGMSGVRDQYRKDSER